MVHEVNRGFLDLERRLLYCLFHRSGGSAMKKGAALSLKAIATARKSEIERIIDGIHGINGRALWTDAMRPSMRKDDPPEDEEN
jgi:hypothetical protein